jgi:hypothetical protein
MPVINFRHTDGRISIHQYQQLHQPVAQLINMANSWGCDGKTRQSHRLIKEQG